MDITSSHVDSEYTRDILMPPVGHVFQTYQIVQIVARVNSLIGAENIFVTRCNFRTIGVQKLRFLGGNTHMFIV
jgi:hypothetical protein